MDDPAYDAFFHELYDSYHRIVFAYLLGRVGQREIAKDLMQEAFLRAWNQIHVGYEMGSEHCRFWIFRITKNLLTDYYRRRTTHERAESRMKQEALVRGSFGRSSEETYEIKSNVEYIESAVNGLPDELRCVLMLHLIGQMNSTEIGELLEIPAGTVRYRISVARKRVNLELARHDLAKEGKAVERFPGE